LAEKQRPGAQGGQSRPANEILANLPDSELEQIQPHLEYQEFSRHEPLCDPEEQILHGYFLNSGMASCLIPTSAGGSVEVALVGRGGFVGNSLLFGVQRSPLRIVVQVPGDGYRIKSEEFQRLLPSTPELFRKVGRHLLLQSMQTAQTAALYLVCISPIRWLCASRRQDRVSAGGRSQPEAR
jgi:CRP-like cAMP-binding protein